MAQSEARALVTGAAQGLGSDIVRVLARDGARVAIADLQEDRGRALADEVGNGAMFVRLDVRHSTSWDGAYAAVVGEFGGLEILVNNAGIVRRASLVDTDEGSYAEIVAINQTGVFLGMKKVLPGMLQAKRGSIVNVASVAGFRVSENRAIYSATKHAVVGMTMAAALESGRHGVRVNVVCPGPMRTPMISENSEEFIQSIGSQTALGRIGEPTEVAELVAFVASDRASYCTGAQFVADGGWSAGFQDAVAEVGSLPPRTLRR